MILWTFSLSLLSWVDMSDVLVGFLQLPVRFSWHFSSRGGKPGLQSELCREL